MREKNSLVATEADIHTLSLPPLSFIDFGNEDEQNVDNFEMMDEGNHLTSFHYNKDNYIDLTCTQS